jgi:hypothetical protein
MQCELQQRKLTGSRDSYIVLVCPLHQNSVGIVLTGEFILLSKIAIIGVRARRNPVGWLVSDEL